MIAFGAVPPALTSGFSPPMLEVAMARFIAFALFAIPAERQGEPFILEISLVRDRLGACAREA